ncbi:MAG: hypothetical protein JOZ55_07395 [Alphaproteobacteria bacterium]|nr:hypothetical protein [Alphaproteobacteria bacterium]
MSAFDHVILLLSFVYALALTHLLSRIGALLNARERVRFSGLQALAMLNAIGFVYANWLAIWDMRSVTQWDLLNITTNFALAVIQYFLCSSAAPEIGDEGAIDLEAFYFRNRQLFYGQLLLLLAMALLSNVAFLKASNPSLFFKENLATLAFMPAVILPLVLASRWAQWVAGIAIFAILIVFMVVFTGTLS